MLSALAALILASSVSSGSQDWKSAFKGQQYDVIVLGTGMKECLLSTLLCKSGRRVLQLDRNPHYGSMSASFPQDEMLQAFGKEAPAGGGAPDSALGNPKSFHLDLTPKFMMMKGKLAKVLLDTGAHRHMQFGPVMGSFIMRNGELHSIPVSAREVTTSPLMAIQDKLQASRFFAWVNRYKPDDPSTHVAGMMKKTTLNLQQMSGAAFLQYWQLHQPTIELAMHGVALYEDDSYLAHPASELVRRMQLYRDSMQTGTKGDLQASPFLYPFYGMGELPQAFARMTGVYGGVTLLERPIDEILYDDHGAACGVRCGEEEAKARCIIGDPTYFPSAVKTVAHTVRVTAIMRHPIEGCGEKSSCHVIIPGSQLERKNNVYVLAVNSEHEVCPKDCWVASLSTVVEGSLEGNVKEIADRELGAALKLILPADQYFVEVRPHQVQTSNGFAERTFVTSSLDASGHVEAAVDEVAAIYYRITGSWPQALSMRV